MPHPVAPPGGVTSAPARWGAEAATLVRAAPLTTRRDPRLIALRRKFDMLEVLAPKPGTWPLPDFFDWDGTNPDMEARWDEFPWGKGPIDEVGS
jgi:hypothetical protein